MPQMKAQAEKPLNLLLINLVVRLIGLVRCYTLCKRREMLVSVCHACFSPWLLFLKYCFNWEVS